jgi:hypothetical protein
MGRRVRVAAILTAFLGFVVGVSQAKENGLTAIVIYDGPSGAAYVQATNLTIAGKLEMRVSNTAETPMDHGFFNKLGKITLGVGGTLERGRDGVLRYTGPDGKTVVVVPLNAKFEHSASLSPAQLADQSAMHGTTTTAGSQLPDLGRGVTVVFVSAPDVELAEYLRARRANDIPGWQAYLAKYPASSHVNDARNRLAGLYAGAGQKALDAYRATADSAEPSYAELKSARNFEEQGRQLSPQLADVAKLNDAVIAALGGIVEKGRIELETYRAALKGKVAGYPHLGTAKRLVETANDIAITKGGQALLDEVMRDYNAVQSAMRQAESSTTAKQFDQAIASVAPYRAFADEEPRIAAVIQANYAYHIDSGKQAGGLGDWDRAIREFEKAQNAKDTAEARSLLVNAREQWTVTQDKAAADKALAESTSYEQAKDIIKAYEVLDNLPASQRKLVQSDLDRLQPAYVQRSSQFAKELRQAHEPLRSLADEVGIQTAYNYLERAYKLSGDESFHDRMDLLGDELSVYLLDQAKRFLAKPSGSGTELGWTYLSEALPFKASNLSAVRDSMTAAASAHAVRSKLSIRVQFRDQTSQRDSAGFAGQLENAVIAGLENLRIPVKVVRTGETTPVEPDYLLEGDVLRHHPTVVPTVETVESEYLSGTREVQSEDFIKANRALDKAKTELATVQLELQGAEAKGNKHAVQEFTKSMQLAQKKVDDTATALDSIPRTVTQDVTRPYTYTKKTVTLNGSIQMQFRIVDSFSNERAEMIPISKEDQKKYVVLENVKSEDTKGVKATGTEVDQTEFMSSVESAALDSLITAVRQHVEELPRKMYQKAREREDGEDLDGAGEAYMRFLELSPEVDSPEVKHARQFLLDQFNMKPASIASAP